MTRGYFILILILFAAGAAIVTLPSFSRFSFASVGISQGATTNGLIGWWKFDDGSGSTAADSSGSGNTGTLTGSPSWVAGKLGDALSFNTSNYVDIGTPTSLEGLQVPLTITAWFNTTTTSGLQTIYGAYSNTSGGDIWSMVRLDGGTLHFYASNSGGSYQSFGSFTPTLNQWHFVAVTVSGSLASPTVTITLDGQSETGSLAALDTTPNTSVDIQIGHNAGPGEGFNGTIDDVRVYNRALSANEIAILYGGNSNKTSIAASASGGGSLGGTLTASWSFDSSTVSGDSVADQSGNGHTLTLVNGASITTGYDGQALTLDGTDQYAWGKVTALPASVALSMWVKANDVSTEQSILVEEDDGAPTSGYHFTLVGIYNGAFYAGFWNINDIASTPINAGQWYHVILTYDGVANTQSLYVDGVLQGTQSGTWQPPSDIYFLVGYQQQGCSFTDNSGHCGDLAHYFNGQIDDLQGYDQAFTQGDVDSLNQSKATVAASSQTLTNGSSLQNGLMALWTFDGPSVDQGVLDDVSGNGNDGTFSSGGLAATIGKLGQAAAFDGASGYMSVPDSSSLDASNITLAGWFKDNAVDGAYHTLVAKWQVGVLQKFVLQMDSDNTFAWWTGNGSTGGDVLESATTPVAGKWYFVAATISGTSKKIYVNGVLDNSGTGSAIGSANVPLTIGSKKDSGGAYFDFFNGVMDDLRVYNRALSAAEIEQLYQLGE